MQLSLRVLYGTKKAAYGCNSPPSSNWQYSGATNVVPFNAPKLIVRAGSVSSPPARKRELVSSSSYHCGLREGVYSPFSLALADVLLDPFVPYHTRLLCSCVEAPTGLAPDHPFPSHLLRLQDAFVNSPVVTLPPSPM